MNWLSKLLSRGPNAAPEGHSLTEYAEDNSDLVDGYVFAATLNLSTPLKWLRMHGAVRSQPIEVPIEFGFWGPVLKGKLALLQDGGTAMSAIGHVPKDGGDLLSFLIKYREIIEGGTNREKMIAALRQLELDNPEIASQLFERCGRDLGRNLVSNDLMSLPGCGVTTAQRLAEAGYLSCDQVLSATVDDLVAIQGIGRATAVKLLSAQNRQRSNQNPQSS